MKKMIYPKHISKNDTIGITAPSDGVTDNLKLKRLDHAKINWKEKGYFVLETPSVRKSYAGKSANSLCQAKELESLFENKEVTYIIAAAGGDFLIEMLSEINWNKLEKNPKWFQGYSDITSINYILTTTYDIATVYASNCKDFGMNSWHSSLENNLKIIEGKKIIQTNFDLYEKEAKTMITGLEDYNLDTPVNYQIITKEKEITMTGRIIGGCIDCLISLCGTKFDHTKKFLEKYKEDGFIWYFDNAELTIEGLIRALWQLKQNGWFKYVKGFLFGRMFQETSYYNISLKDALLRILEEYQVPIITNMDFGHIPPRITIINGSMSTIQIHQNQMKFQMEEK